MITVEPQAEHRWLQRLVGVWTYEGDAGPGPDKERAKFTGTETISSIGDVWIRSDARGEMPGGSTAIMQVTLGFDPQKGRFVGSWVGSMMTYLWIYEGTLDSTQRVLTLDAHGPSMRDDGSTAHYQDVIEWVDDNNRLFKSRVLQDGTWNEFMLMRYRRVK